MELGLFKDKCNGKIINSFVNLQNKFYYFIIH